MSHQSQADEWVDRGGPLPADVTDEFRERVCVRIEKLDTALHILERRTAYETGLARMGISTETLRTRVRNGLQAGVERVRNASNSSAFHLCVAELLVEAWDAAPDEQPRLLQIFEGNRGLAPFRALLDGSPPAVAPECCLRHLLNFEDEHDPTPHQWKLIRSAVEASQREEPSLGGLLRLCALGLRGRMSGNQVEWSTLLQSLGVRDEELMADYRALRQGNGRALAGMDAPGDLAGLFEAFPMVVGALAHMGIPHDLQRVKQMQLIRRIAPAGTLDPWVDMSVQAVRSGREQGAQVWERIVDHAERLGLTLSEEDAGDLRASSLWDRAAHFDYWTSDGRLTSRVRKTVRREIREMAGTASAAGRLRLAALAAELGVLDDVKTKMAHTLRVDRPAMDELRDAYRTHSAGPFQCPVSVLGDGTLEQVVQLGEAGLAGLVGSQQHAATLVAETADYLEHRVASSVPAGRKWLVTLVRQFEQGHEISLRTAESAHVIEAYDIVRAAFYRGDATAFDAVDGRVLFALAERATLEGIAGAKEALEALVEAQVKLVRDRCGVEDRRERHRLSGLLAGVAEQVLNPDRPTRVDRALVDALRTGDSQAFLEAVAPSVGVEQTVDAFRDSTPWKAVLAPALIIVASLLMGVVLISRYGPVPATMPPVTMTRVKPILDPGAEGFSRLTSVGDPLWIRPALTTQTGYERFMPLRTPSGIQGQTAFVTHAQVERWCEIYLDYLRARYPGGVGGRGWVGVTIDLPTPVEWSRLRYQLDSTGPEWLATTGRPAEAPPLFPVGGPGTAGGTREQVPDLAVGIGFRYVLRQP